VVGGLGFFTSNGCWVELERGWRGSGGGTGRGRRWREWGWVWVGGLVGDVGPVLVVFLAPAPVSASGSTLRAAFFRLFFAKGRGEVGRKVDTKRGIKTKSTNFPKQNTESLSGVEGGFF